MNESNSERYLQITPEKALNSIYIDFEGEGAGPTDTMPLPHMLGAYTPKSILRPSCYQAYLFRDNWKAIANGCHGELADFSATIKSLVKQAKRQGGYLVYFSVHEYNMIQAHCDETVFKAFREVCFNMKPPLDRMYNRTHPGQTQMRPGSLKEYAKFYFPHFALPDMSVGVGVACRRLDETSELGLRWRQWPKPRKQLAHKLIHYNRVDCMLTWKLTKKLANHQKARKPEPEAA